MLTDEAFKVLWPAICAELVLDTKQDPPTEAEQESQSLAVAAKYDLDEQQTEDVRAVLRGPIGY